MCRQADDERMRHDASFRQQGAQIAEEGWVARPAGLKKMSIVFIPHAFTIIKQQSRNKLAVSFRHMLSLQR